jgi:hypothetical protein
VDELLPPGLASHERRTDEQVGGGERHKAAARSTRGWWPPGPACRPTRRERASALGRSCRQDWYQPRWMPAWSGRPGRPGPSRGPSSVRRGVEGADAAVVDGADLKPAGQPSTTRSQPQRPHPHLGSALAATRDHGRHRPTSPGRRGQAGRDHTERPAYDPDGTAVLQATTKLSECYPAEDRVRPRRPVSRVVQRGAWDRASEAFLCLPGPGGTVSS